MAAKLTILSALVASSLWLLGSTTAAQAVPNTPLPTPQLVSPASGAIVDSVPPFAWSAVEGADHYEFQLAADAGFNSPVLGHGSDSFTTSNMRATVQKTFPNGAYYWRVPSVGADGSVSSWSPGWLFRKSRTGAASLHSPAPG